MDPASFDFGVCNCSGHALAQPLNTRLVLGEEKVTCPLVASSKAIQAARKRDHTWLVLVYPDILPAGKVMNLLRLLYSYD